VSALAGFVVVLDAVAQLTARINPTRLVADAARLALTGNPTRRPRITNHRGEAGGRPKTRVSSELDDAWVLVPCFR
jgi:hypothetical protein